jgi:serine/threonine-protein kinase RsbW
MAEEFTTGFKNELTEVERVNLAVTGFLAARNLPPRLVYAVNLAVEELATNVIKYGYDDAAEHQLHLGIRLDQQSLRVTLIDDGHAFNPLSLPEVDVSQSLDDREVGGLGIHLVKKLFDEVAYERREGKNIFTAAKQFNQET